jgi:hypothetical protein
MIYSQGVTDGFNIFDGKGGYESIIKRQCQNAQFVFVVKNIQSVTAVFSPAVGHEDVVRRGYRGRRRGDRGQGAGRREKIKTCKERLEFLTILSFYRFIMLVALVDAAVIADAVGIKFDAGKRFWQDAFSAKAHGESSLQLTVDSL